MKHLFYLLFAMMIIGSCKEKQSSEKALEDKLMQTMKQHLDKNARPGVESTVIDVLFDERDRHYYCEFRVNLKSSDKDTTGTMVALISKDFKTVERSQ
jgi:hypothetical protein